jgi:hypothetical protein
MVEKWSSVVTYVICPDCKGEGTKGPGFVYTQDDIAEQFDSPDDFAEHVADIRRGVYDQPCPYCRGRRVVQAEQAAGWQEEQDYRAAVEAERRFGA